MKPIYLVRESRDEGDVSGWRPLPWFARTPWWVRAIDWVHTWKAAR